MAAADATIVSSISDVRRAINEVRSDFCRQFDGCFSMPIEKVEQSFKEMLENTRRSRLEDEKPLSQEEALDLRRRVFAVMAKDPNELVARIESVYGNYSRINDIIEDILALSREKASQEQMESRIRAIVERNDSYLDVMKDLLKIVQKDVGNANTGSKKGLSREDILSKLKDCTSCSRSGIGNELAAVIDVGRKKRVKKEAILERIHEMISKHSEEIRIINQLEKTIADADRISKKAVLIQLSNITHDDGSRNQYLRSVQRIMRRSSVRSKDELLGQIREVAAEMEDVEKTLAVLSRITATFERMAKEEVMEELQTLLSSVYSNKLGRRLNGIIEAAEKDKLGKEQIMLKLQEVLSDENHFISILSRLNDSSRYEDKNANAAGLRKFSHEISLLFSSLKRMDHRARQIRDMRVGPDQHNRYVDAKWAKKMQMSSLVLSLVDDVKAQIRRDSDTIRIEEIGFMLSDYASGIVDTVSVSKSLKDVWYISTNHVKNSILQDLSESIRAEKSSEANSIEDVTVHLCTQALRDDACDVELAVNSLKTLRAMIMRSPGKRDRRTHERGIEDAIVHSSVDALRRFNGDSDRRVRLMCIEVLGAAARRSPAALHMLKTIKDHNDRVVKSKVLKMIDYYGL